jgi:ABC-2 type transport system permease protein
VWINQSLLMVVYLWGWWEVTRTIQSGAIATELLKPYDYFAYWLSRDLGRGLAHILLRGVPTFITGFLLFDVLLPETGWRVIGFLLSIPLAITVSFCLRFIANLGGFWVMDYRGLMSIYVATINILSGMLAPLAFLPGPLRDLANVLPFRAVIMTPNEIYLGQVGIMEGLVLQAGWIVALIVVAKSFSEWVSADWWCKVGSFDDLRHDVRVALRIAALRLRGQMQYRSSFLMQIGGQLRGQLRRGCRVVVVVPALRQSGRMVAGRNHFPARPGNGHVRPR